MAQALSVSSLSMNNETIKIVPNSFIIKAGVGERNTRWASSGGLAGEGVTTINAETLLGDFKFDLFSTQDNIAKVQEWASRVDNNSLSASHSILENGQRKYVTLTFDHAVMQNDPDIELTSDGKISLEWKSDPVSYQ